MTKELDIFMQDDGFYVGRQLKNGKMAKGSYKLTGNDILTMFAKFYNDYRTETGSNELAMTDDDGAVLVTMRVEKKKNE